MKAIRVVLTCTEGHPRRATLLLPPNLRVCQCGQDVTHLRVVAAAERPGGSPK